jgi:tetratricopeptide (TPR) repeat protein
MRLGHTERSTSLTARLARVVPLALALTLSVSVSSAATSAEALARFRQGDHAKAAELAALVREADPSDESAHLVEIRALIELGHYEEAHARSLASLESTRASIRLRLVGLETARLVDDREAFDARLVELRTIVVTQARFVRDPASLVAIGEAALLLGVEPRLVLENFFKRGREATPPVREAFLAAGRLALAKGDDALASRTFQQGIAAFPGDADMWAGIAAAFLEGDRSKLVEYANHALELNPAHATAALLLVEHAIDAERYADARETLDEILRRNPRRAEALAFSAVLALLDNDEATAARRRDDALLTWPTNARVDHIIGRKLSQKYRFAEGAAYQRRALELDPTFTPAKLQLAQDLLRLGRDEEGWSLAAAAHQADGYDVAAYNLVSLRDRISSLTELRTPHFVLRMSGPEAAVYGARALALLEEARVSLLARYGLELEEPVAVEIHPDPKDFAVRTFGMPDNPGFLGVCFGPLITINSPATRQANWEAVLWHEFVHTVTLSLTRNRMPRWLSEGISVEEETRRDASWGQRMTLDYHTRILSGRMQPISRMSAAFLEASDGEDLQFAYFQSWLAVRYLIETHGFEKLRELLVTLGTGRAANDALASVYAADASPAAALDALDAGFVSFARDQAREFARGLDFSAPNDLLEGAIARLNPRNFFGRLTVARSAVEAEDWEQARSLFARLAEEAPYLPGEYNLHRPLAAACRRLLDTEGERVALESIAAHESAPVDAVSRLLELARDSGDHAAAVRWADRWLAVHPLAPSPWRALLDAHESLGQSQAAALAGQALLKLDPRDRPSIHYRVARALRDSDMEAARLNVLLALEDAPRFREAHELLLSLPEKTSLR